MPAVAAIVAITMPASPADASVRQGPGQNTGGRSIGSLGIKMLDIPTARIKDPRARAYIVDFLKPGTTIHRRIQISNSSRKLQHVALYAGGATIVHDAFLGDNGRTANELSSWVSLPAPSVDLPPGTNKAVMVTVAVPSTASAGERYGVVWAQVSQPPTAGSSIGQINRVGIRLYLDVGPGGEPPTNFAIGPMTVTMSPGPSPGTHPSPSLGPWPVITAQVRNTGQRAVDMVGTLSLANGDGGIKAGPFPVVDGVTILPGQSGPVSVLLDKPLPGGPWRAKLTLTSGVVTRSETGTVTLPGPPPPPRPVGLSRTLRSVYIAGGAALAMVILLPLGWYLLRRRFPTARA
jgi:hypothetical protein